ncbi:DJ-1/PfpI family protein [Streptomyces sp. TRM 70361]|uniref:DJ-1/PfpI family protein n=1 Tax=Streptomyces sp. TRM 70361 TaxID=3116553 RepID=UPI002E7AC653|nr:DJ-1/PfpI family protein [Streptomyces sp. TRM 70361]MEE1943390.1 DJ-1/PfpI family protein [Streptomyces sp. TRM 70361]
MERRNVLLGAAALGTGAPAGQLAGAGTAAAAPRTGPLRVHVVVFDGADELDFIAPHEVFSLARTHSEHGVEVSYVTTGRPRLVRAAHGTGIEVGRTWAPRSADVIVVPGGDTMRRGGPGIWAEIDGGVLPRVLAAAPRRGLTIASVCTGAILLAEAGLVRGRPCTTHHRARAELEARGGVFKNARVVDDGDVVTAGGITSGLDLALWLVKREAGPDAATEVETMLEYQARGTVWSR